MSNLPSIDTSTIAEMKEILGEDLSDILLEFKDEIPTYKEQLGKFCADNDVEKLLMLAHSIKSSSGNLGLLKISDFCKQIEEGLRSNSSMDVQDLIKHSQNELDILVDEINIILQSLS